jgi:16S rRNA (uracil1498-N3)-methyltransferase
MEQFIFNDDNLKTLADGKKTVVLVDDEHFHLSRVLRVRPGEKVLATNGSGKSLLCVVRVIGKRESECEVVEEFENLNSPPRHFCIAMSLLKPMSKLEMALEKCTELGAGSFLLFHSERSEKIQPRLDRLEGIIKSAVKQSLRSSLPGLKFVESLAEAAASGRSYNERIVLHEKSGNMIKSHILQMKTDGSVIALIGPEGGFSEKEIALLIENGYKDFSLGKTRLRSETAAIAIASLLFAY